MKILKNFCLFVLVLFASSCDRVTNENWWQDNGKVKVLSTIAMITNIVKEIGKGRIDCATLIFDELDPHSYELVKGDDEKMHRADIILYNGLGLEHGASLSQFLKKSTKSLALGDELYKKKPEWFIEVEGTLDPHIWMDVSLWVHIIDPIVDALSKKDPEGALFYQENAKELKKNMYAIDRSIHEKLHQIPPDKRFLVTSHDAFHYFTRRYLSDEKDDDWKKRVAAPEGLAPEMQLSSVDIQKIIDYMHENNIHVIFPESNVSQDSIRKIVSAGKEKGLQIEIAQIPLYGDAVKPMENPEENGYFSMMLHNAEILCEYLQ